MIPLSNTTNRVDTEAINRAVDLVELAGKHTQLAKESSREWAGPCPKCGGDDRFHCTADWFTCRQCHPKRGDAIEFVRWTQGSDFLAAVAYLSGGSFTYTSHTPSHTPGRPLGKTHKEHAGLPTWAAKHLAAAQDRLLNLPAGQPGRDYLLGRCLLPETWRAMGMGFDPAVAIPGTQGKWQDRPKAPAIAIPWHSEGGELVAVRYRFLVEQNGHKLTSMQGSQFAGNLFGAHAMYPSKQMTLVVCEGEINDASIWQVAGHTHVDVLSIGSEGGTIPDRYLGLIALYGGVVTWLDKPEHASRIAGLVPGALARKSVDGKDANDCLKAGTLGGMIAAARLRLCRNDDERLALLFALYDGGLASPGLDNGTVAVVRRLAADLGQSVTLRNIGGAWFTGTESFSGTGVVKLCQVLQI